MRAVVMRNKKLITDDLPTPEPGEGEVLVKTLACGICGTDLHAFKHAEQFVERVRRVGSPHETDLSRDIVMGHEFCSEIVDYGPSTTRNLKLGTRVCGIPRLVRPDRTHAVGFSCETPGGFAEYMPLTESLLFEVPEDLSSEQAALTEPMAVGRHAVEKAQLDRNDVALVIGCGPIGLAVIAALRLKGVRPIIAVDFSRRRRGFAEALGADVVVDPAEHSPYETWSEVAAWENPEDAPPSHPLFPGPSHRPAVIFECVGIPGVIEQIMASAPRDARIVGLGLCMERDQFEPAFGVLKELVLQFVIGYSLEEFGDTLRGIADGKIPVEPLITGKVGLEGVADAFEELYSPEKHAKIVVEPTR